MASDIKEVTLLLKVDSSGALTSVQNFVKGMDGVTVSTQRQQGVLDGLVKKLVALGLAYKAYDFARDSLNMAAAAERSSRIFNMAFGSMAEEARKWVTSTSTSLKVQQSDIEKTSAAFKTMFDNMGFDSRQAVAMSKSLTTLGTELDIVYGLAEGEGADKLRMGIMGMGRSLQSLNIVINDTMVEEYALREGWIQHGQKLTETGQAYARYNLILEQSKKVQDGLKEASKGYSEQLRQLKTNYGEVKESLGQALMPEMTKVMQDTNKFLEENQGRIKEWAENAGWAIERIAAAYKAYCDAAERVVNIDKIFRDAWENRQANQASISGANRNPFSGAGGNPFSESGFTMTGTSGVPNVGPTPQGYWDSLNAANPDISDTDLWMSRMDQYGPKNRKTPAPASKVNGEGTTATGAAPGFAATYVDRTAYKQVLEQLEFEREQLSRSNLEREQRLALQEAGVSWDEQEADAIKKAVDELDKARKLRAVADDIGDAFGRAFESIIFNARSAKEAVLDLAMSIMQSVFRKTVTEPLANAISGAIMSWGSGGGGQVGLGSPGVTGYHVPHIGGLIGTDPLPMRYMPTSLLTYAPRLHNGLAADEYPAILQTGERVQSRAEVAAERSGSVQWNVRLDNRSSQALAGRVGRVDPRTQTVEFVLSDLRNNGRLARTLRGGA